MNPTITNCPARTKTSTHRNVTAIGILTACHSRVSSNKSLSLHRFLWQKWPSPFRLCGHLMKPARFMARGRTATLPDPPSTISYGPRPYCAASPGTQLSACLNSSAFLSTLVNWKYIKHGFIKVKHVFKYFAELQCASGQRSPAQEGCSPTKLYPSVMAKPWPEAGV